MHIFFPSACYNSSIYILITRLLLSHWYSLQHEKQETNTFYVVVKYYDSQRKYVE